METEAGYLFTDWSDAGIGNPFCSFASFLIEGPNVFPDPGITVLLRDAYLDAWGGFAPREDLVRLFTLAQLVALTMYAGMYHRELLPRMDARWEKLWTLRYVLRLVLHYHRDVQPDVQPEEIKPKQSKPRKARTPSRPNQPPRSMRRLQR